MTAPAPTPRRVLVTGATGLVGTQLLEELRALPGVDAVGTSRRGGLAGAAIAWDIAAEPPPPALDGPWDAVVNTAANVSFTMDAATARLANVATLDGLAAVVGPETHVVHTSTAYATGLRGSIASEELADYRTTYEWSKAAAERLAADRFARLTIVRPSIIIGRRADGHAARYAGLFTTLRGIAMSSIPALPALADGYCDVVPVDDVTRVLVELALLPGSLTEAPVRTVAGGAGAPTVDEVGTAMVDALNAWRTAHGAVPLDRPRIFAPEAWNRFFLPFARQHLSQRQLASLDLVATVEPYLQLTEPLAATDPVTGALDAVTTSVEHWATRYPRLAGMPPRPWQSPATTPAPVPA